MYGRYTKDLGEFAKDEARKLKLLEKRRKQEDKQRNKVKLNGIFNTKHTMIIMWHTILFIYKYIQCKRNEQNIQTYLR